MDEQTSPATEPAITAPDQTATDSPTVPEPAPASETTAVLAPEPVATNAEVVIVPAPEATVVLQEPAMEASMAQSVGNEPLTEAPVVTPPPAVASPRSHIREFLQVARDSITGRKTKKLERIMELVEKKGKVTNDDVEKLLRVSDATATRYLSELEKQGKIVPSGGRGRFVSYRKVP